MRKLFISFEGGEGAGKSTQIRMLHGYLVERGNAVVVVRDPGGAKISEKIREILKDKTNSAMSPRTEALLCFAARAQTMDEIIQPALEGGKIVISDRFSDSTFVYQGIAGGLSLGCLQGINGFAVADIMPNITFYLKINAKDGLARKIAQKELDRIESRGSQYHTMVQEGYEELAKSDKGNKDGRIVTIDATLPAAQIHTAIVSYVKKFL